MLLTLAATASLAACYGRPPHTASPGPSPRDAATTQQASIGSATMEADGTIVLMLRAETGSTVGDAMFRYPPSHAQYQSILRHVGPMQPGQSRPVAPFPEQSGR